MYNATFCQFPQYEIRITKATHASKTSAAGIIIKSEKPKHIPQRIAKSAFFHGISLLLKLKNAQRAHVRTAVCIETYCMLPPSPNKNNQASAKYLTARFLSNKTQEVIVTTIVVNHMRIEPAQAELTLLVKSK